MKIKLIGSDKEFSFSDIWQQVESMPEDPPNSIVIMKASEICQAMVLFYPIDINNAMPFDNPQNVINGIHNSLGDDQGIIEVESNIQNNKYIYSIIKTRMENSGMQYCLTLHFCLENKIYNVTGFFTECGITGIRDTQVYELARRDGIVNEKMEGWTNDPYDKEYNKGVLMNISENKYFDEYFPEHALSETRNFIKELIMQI